MVAPILPVPVPVVCPTNGGTDRSQMITSTSSPASENVQELPPAPAAAPTTRSPATRPSAATPTPGHATRP